MIKDMQAYRRSSDAERDETLRRMTVEDSIAIGEALLTSEIMQRLEPSDDDHPRSLAISLGIVPPSTGT